MKTVYYGGRVYTGAMPLVEAFIVEDGRFTFAGSSAEALSAAGGDADTVDLGGQFVCAGFNDSHMHLLNYGQALYAAPLHAHTGSLADMLQCLREYAAEHPAGRGGWIVGCGWNHDYFTDIDRMPNRWDLDQVSTERPVLATRACGHTLVVNSKALELLNITADTPCPDGGQIVMENGQPNGVFFDNAMDYVINALPAPGEEELKDMLRAACKSLNSYGVTSCQSDDYGVFHNLPWQAVNDAFRALEQSGELTVRVCEQSNFSSLPALKAFVEAGNRTGTGTDFFRIGPLKMLGDGALGARTAYLSRPYADDPDTVGLPVFSQEVFDEMIGYANAEGMQTAVHTIGDACLDRVLQALEKALQANPRSDHRHGVVHCQITRPDQLAKIAAMGLHVYAQSIFLDYDIHIVEQRVGAELASTSYCWKTLSQTGATVSNGTDCPVELPNALAGIQCTVTRCTLSGDGPYLPAEAFTAQQAIDSYTSAGAYASFEEQRKGQIRPGMLADFVVLGDDPLSVSPETISRIPVCATYVGGRCVYRA